MERKQAKDLLDFIYNSPTAFHAVQFVEKPPVKKAEGFCLLVVDKV